MSKAFLSLGLEEWLVQQLGRHIRLPTLVQSRAIPRILKGRDLMVQAKTGSGKTLAFVLPVLQRIQPDSTHIQALILSPTRELAQQTAKTIQELCRNTPIQVLPLVGGEDVERQLRKLEGKVHLVVATPGRLLAHLEKRRLSLHQIRFLVLDEADQMLSMGFLEEVGEVLAYLPKQRQTLLFSATLSPAVRQLARKVMQQPVELQVDEEIDIAHIRHILVRTSPSKKLQTLVERIQRDNPFLALVFCRTKEDVSEVHTALARAGFEVDELQGGLSQSKRRQVLRRFREAELQVLVATDLAARGLDVEGITHVYNFEVPRDAQTYIHRSGRTGRAGDSGDAVTLYTPEEEGLVARLEQKLGRRFVRQNAQGETILQPPATQSARTRKRTKLRR